MKRKFLFFLLLINVFCAEAQEKELKIGDNAPALHIQEWIKGAPVTEFKKGKVYVVDVSEIFCPGCLKIIPELTQISQKYRDDVEVFVVYSYATPLQAKKFADKMGNKMNYGIAVDTKDNLTSKNWSVTGYPTCFVVNQEGKIAFIGFNVADAVESIVKTGKYEADALIQQDKYAKLEQNNVIWKGYEKRRNDYCQKENYKELIQLIDSLMPFAPAQMKYDEGGRHGLLYDKMKVYLLNNDSVAADNCLKDMMALTTEGWWVHLHSIFQTFVPPFSGQRLLPFNYQRYREIAKRAADDGGGADKVGQLCLQATIVYAYTKNKQEALAVLNEAAEIAKKNRNADETKSVEETILRITKADKKHQQANADWDSLTRFIAHTGHYAIKDNDWVSTAIKYEKDQQTIRALCVDFWSKYPTDERSNTVLDIYSRAHLNTLVPWLDTNRVSADVAAKINTKYKKGNEYIKQGELQGRKIATGPPLFRMFPLDFKAEAEWWLKRDEMFRQKISDYNNTQAEKERIEWNQFTSDWGQAVSVWGMIPDMDENPESETSIMENDYWELFAAHYWEAMWLKYQEHVSKYADLPVIADRALDFLGATGGVRHSKTTAKKYWERIATIYGNPSHPLHQMKGIKALLKQAQLQVDADDVAAGKKAVELQFTAFDGREVDLAKLRGKIIIVDFWATWCKPCLESMPHLKEMYDKYHDKGLEIIGISLDPGLWKGKIEEGNREQIQKVLDKYNVTWPQRFTGRATDDPFAKMYSIEALPTVWLLDKNGIIVDKNARGERLEPLIMKYLLSN